VNAFDLDSIKQWHYGCSLGSKLSAKLAGDPRVAAFLDGSSVGEEVEATLVKVMEALSGLDAAHSVPLHVTVFHHRADEDAVRVSVLGPVKQRGLGHTHFSHPPLLNLDPRVLIAGLAQQHLFAVLHELLYGSLMAENQRRMQHMDSAVRRLERTSADLLLGKNATAGGDH
jgi:F-type H+-transporting ATPase subunit gamma